MRAAPALVASALRRLYELSEAYRSFVPRSSAPTSLCHEIAAAAEDLARAEDGLPPGKQVPATPTWLDRMPTPTEVEAHSAAHPFGEWIGVGLWLRREQEPWLRGELVPRIHELMMKSGEVCSNRASLMTWRGEHWLPLTAEGLPAPLPVVAAKGGA